MSKPKTIAAVLALLAGGLVSSGASAATGRTPGTFDVSASGAATYTIPVWAPPGPRSIQPNIALTYSSGVGNGIAGVGWALGGVSSIERCPPVIYSYMPIPIQLSAADWFCIDGNQLRATGGTTYGAPGATYQTETANFSLITSYGVTGTGPTSFSVQGRNGLTYEYGNTADSRVIPGSAATVLRWMLNRVSDRSGNSYTVTYNTATGFAVPATISWTRSNATSSTYVHSLRFAYTQRSDKDSYIGSIAGQPIENRNLLNSITVQSSAMTGSDATVKKYFLDYELSPTTQRSRLIAIQECSDDLRSDCLLPTQMNYQDVQSGSGAVRTATTGATSVMPGSFDLNGDGKDDLIFGTGGYWHVSFSQLSGFSAGVNTGIATSTAPLLVDRFVSGSKDGFLASVSGQWVYYGWNGSAFSGTNTGIAVGGTAANTISADVNGDGLVDLVWRDSSTAQVYIRNNTTPSGGVTPIFSLTAIDAGIAVTGVNGPYNSILTQRDTRLRRMDFNGDGKQDIVASYIWGVEGGYPPYTPIFTIWYITARPMLSTGTGFVYSTQTYTNYYTPQTLIAYGDLNSDRCTDVIGGSYNGVFDCATSSGPYAGGSSGYGVGQVAMMDWDGDGKKDFVLPNGTVLSVGLSTNTGMMTVGTAIPYSSANSYFAMDEDGDGLDDLVMVSGQTVSVYGHSSQGFTTIPNPGQGITPDTARVITDGFVTYAVGYVSTAQSNYTAGAATPYPLYDNPSSLIVVGAIAVSDGIGSVYNKTYSYVGAKMDSYRRVSAGFMQRTETDSRTGLIRKTQFQQDFPNIGRIFQEDIYQSDNTPVSHTAITNAKLTLESAEGLQRYFPYVQQIVKNQYEVGGIKNGQLITTETTNYTYDMYGNATNVATTVTDNDLGSPQWTSTTVTTVTPDSGANWCLNQPINVAVTSSATGVPAITRTVGYTVDYLKCRATHKTVEPSSGLYALTEAYGFDNFGNVNLATTTGIGVTARATGVNWGVMGLFPMTITNALNETAQRGYDFNLGVLTSTTDANGIQLSSQYDTFGRKIRESRADGTYTVLTYNDCANTGGCLIGSHALAITSTVYNSDNSVFTDGTTYFDPYDRALIDSKRLFAGGYDRNEVRYDNLGRVAQRFMPCTWASVMVACETWTTYTYDLLGRLTSESRPINANNSAPQTTTIDYQGRTTIFTDPQGKRSTRVATVTGDMGKSQDHNGYYQNFGYDAFGSLTSVTDSQSNSLFSASYEYGVDAFQTGTTDMDLGSRGFAYNALGETTAYTDANGASFGMTYDPLSRLKTRTVAGEGTTTFVMGDSAANFNIGQLLSVSSTGGPTETYMYDSKGRLSRKQIVSDATYNYDYTYNSHGLLDTVTYPVSTSSYRLTLRYAYQNGFLYQVKDADASTVFWQANTMNVRGQTTQDTLGNGLVTNRSFDAVTGWINSIQCGVAGGACAQNQSYLFDFVGNLIQRQNNNVGLTENFYYDDLYRLHDSQLNGATNLTMSYDAMGNITSKSDVAGGAAWTYSASRKHQVTQAGNSSYTYSYDSNGNAITRNGYGITWNKYNYPTLINGNGESTALSYDGNHARWKQVYTKGQTTETTIYAGDQLEKVSVGGVDDYRHYIDANGQTVAIMSRTTLGANNTRYVLSDAQGGVTKITDSSGASVVSESFTAFGARRNPATWSGSPTNGDVVASNGVTMAGFTGHDALGGMNLIHMNGRVQDAITGRFLSADPYTTEPDNTQNYNRYSYVHNNPMTFTDPSGFQNCFEYEYTGWGLSWQNGVQLPTVSGMFARICIPDLVFMPDYMTSISLEPRQIPETPQKTNCPNTTAADTDDLITFDDFVNFSAGLGDVLLLGFGDDIRGALDIGSVDMSSSAYGAGEITGTAAMLATGVAGGIRAAGTAGVRGSGIEFSHAIPARMGGPRSIWNGNFVSREFHALSDPFRYRFMPRAWKELNQMPSRLKQLWDRTPKTWKGTAAGAAAAGAGAAGSGC